MSSNNEPTNDVAKLGFWSSTSVVVGNMIGSGIFLLPATLALYGGISVVGWLCSAVGTIVIALIFGELGRLALHAIGGPYAYTRVGLGDFAAFLVAWSYWISIWCTNAAIAVALVSYLSVFFPELAQSQTGALAAALSVIWFLTWINFRRITIVGSVQLGTTILKIVPLLLIGLVGIFYVDPSNFPAFNPGEISVVSALTSTTMLTFFAFLGMESAAITGNRIQNAGSTIRKATIFGTLVTVGVYLLSSVAVMGLVPSEMLSQSNAPYADAAEVFLGSAARYFVAAGALISTFGALNGWILMQGLIPMSAADDKLFPKAFARLNKSHSPVLGLVISSVLASILIALNYAKGLVEAFTFMVTLSTLAVLTPYLFSAASYVLILSRQGKKRMAPHVVLALIAFAFSFWVVIGTGQEVVFWGFLLLLAGVPFYVWVKRG